MHLFIKCPFTRQVWDIITLDQNLNTIWEGTTISACYDYWSTRECNLKHLPSLVYWFIWLDRNKKFFENGTPSTSIVAYKTLGMLKNWKYIHLSKVVNQIKNRTLNTEDTPTGWFSGATQSNGTQSGAGGLISVLKNSQYRWTFNCGSGTNTVA